jgi:hypothetical protein
MPDVSYFDEGNLELAAKYLERVPKSDSVSEETVQQAAALLKEIRKALRQPTRSSVKPVG